MRVTIISPDGAVYEGDASSVIAPAFDGEVGILPRHAAFMTLLGRGRVVVRRGEDTRTFTVRGGFLQVRDDVVRVVTEAAEGDTHAS
jgi:F-type H+-transporting ATPase subunit epsilon